MSDEEIERIKEVAKPKVGVSAVPSWATHSWYHGAVWLLTRLAFAYVLHESTVGY